MKTEFLFGIHPVQAAILAGRRKIFEIYVAGKSSSKRQRQIIQLAAERRLTVTAIEDTDLSTLLGTRVHQGIAARVSHYPLSSLTEILNAAPGVSRQVLLLLLDNIHDPHNLGAIARSAAAVGVWGLIIPQDRAASPSPHVCKISAGALEHLRLVRVKNLVRTMQALKRAGLWFFGLDLNAEQSLFASNLSGPLAIVVGGEEKGLRPLVRKHCDFLISIPQTGPVGALNASVAGAVALYEVFRQRQTQNSAS